jgi:hypothetical protein
VQVMPESPSTRQLLFHRHLLPPRSRLVDLTGGILRLGTSFLGSHPTFGGKMAVFATF